MIKTACTTPAQLIMLGETVLVLDSTAMPTAITVISGFVF